MDGKDAILRNWAAFLKQTNHNDRYQALEVESPSVARTAVDAWQLVNLTGLITTDGLTAHGHRVVDGTADVEDALALGVRECMIGQDGIEIVPLLQRGETILAKTNHVWACCCPGLLPIEIEAIVYWAIDRLIHHASIIKLEGGSYRRRQQMNVKKEKKNRQR